MELLLTFAINICKSKGSGEITKDKINRNM